MYVIKIGDCLLIGWVIVWLKDGGRRIRVYGNLWDRDIKVGLCFDR